MITAMMSIAAVMVLLHQKYQGVEPMHWNKEPSTAYNTMP